MKKTVTINISGIIFNIDEDAYEKLQAYLSAISSRFSNAEEGSEIIADIEARIAELFSQKINPGKQVINIDDVEDIIGVMGSPSDYGGDETSGKKSSFEGDKEFSKSEEKKSFRNKRIYRDTENRVLGGVCSGLGSYFNIDPVFIRIFMVITFFAFGPLLYLILWVAIPAARTTAQRLEMKGEKVNISNIEKSIREEFEEVKQNFKKMKNTQTYKNSESFLERLGHLAVVVITAIGKLFIAFIGVIFVIVGVSLLLAFLATFVFGVSDISIGDSAVTANQFMALFMGNDDTMLVFVSVILLIAIPLFSVIYAGVKMIFKIKTRNRVVGWLLTAVWFISLIYIIIFSVDVARNYKVQETVVNRNIVCHKTDTLFIKSTLASFAENNNNIIKHFDDDFDEYSKNDLDINIIDGEPRILGCPNISIEKSDSNVIEVIVKKKSRGKTNRQAKENAYLVDYDWKTVELDSINNNLIFDSHFILKKGAKWRNPRVDVLVKVPVGCIVVLDKSLNPYLNDILNLSNIPEWEMAGKTWKMNPEGFVLLK